MEVDCWVIRYGVPEQVPCNRNGSIQSGYMVYGTNGTGIGVYCYENRYTAQVQVFIDQFITTSK